MFPSFPPSSQTIRNKNSKIILPQDEGVLKSLLFWNFMIFVYVCLHMFFLLIIQVYNSNWLSVHSISLSIYEYFLSVGAALASFMRFDKKYAPGKKVNKFQER